MNATLKAVIIELTAGNVRNHHVNLRGVFGLFPADCLGGKQRERCGCADRSVFRIDFGRNRHRSDEGFFRERGAIRRFFDDEGMQEGDLVLIERREARTFSVSKASKRGFKYYL